MKGQAFDTFKLLIAAVVAVTILGILLGILNLVKPPGTEPGNLISQKLQMAAAAIGSTYVSESKADFSAGTEFAGSSFIAKLGSLGDVYIYCSENLVDNGYCTNSATQGESILIDKVFQEKIKVKCCESDKCAVMIGTDAIDCATAIP